MSPHQSNKSRRSFIRQSVFTAAILPFLYRCGEGPKSGSTVQAHGAIAKFKNAFSGQIILPGDADYESRRWSQFINPATDKRPEVIASCKTEDDIKRSIAFAREQNLEIAVRSGNHSNMGWGTCDKGMVIDLSKFKAINVNSDKHTAMVTAGATAEEILAATVPFGLVPVLGECGTVGSGIVLGGGLGWFSGKFGATCDNLVSSNIVTVDGDLRRADAITNEDLFWGIRGGGGNFGIASSFEYKLYPLKEMLKGSFFYSIKKAPAVIKYFNEFMTEAPDELQADCYLSKDTCFIEFVFFGELRKGEAVLDKFRKANKPEKENVKRRPVSELYSTSDDPGGPAKFISSKGTYIEHISDDVIRLVLDQLQQAPASASAFCDFSHFMHGEVCRIAPDTNAFELRQPGASHLAFWITWNDAEHGGACMKWHDETFEKLQSFSGGRIYANYMSTPGGSNAKSVFGNNFSRLAQLKKKYDPNNILHLNQNIIPSAT